MEITTMKKITTFLLLSSALLLAMNVNAKKQPPSIIFLIGDGMGVAYTSAYRYYQDDPNTPNAEITIFDELLVGMASSYPHDEHFNVTDSAAAATALATGTKTFNGAIGINNNKEPMYSLLDVAKQQGYLTGIAVTSHVAHATPAAFVAHVSSRASYNEIADQYVDVRIQGKPKVDVIFGAGKSYFIRTDRNLINEFEALGYSYEPDFKNLSAIKKYPVIGLFADTEMPSALDGAEPLRLTKMADKALSLLSDKPFFLMLEASQIDWCGHINDIACAMAEMHDMAETMKVIKKYIDRHPNTIFVATADHSTGGLSLGANNQYNWFPQVIKRIKASSKVMPEKLLTSTNWTSEWQLQTGLKLTAEETQDMAAALAAARKQKTPDTMGKIQNLVLAYYNRYTSTGWTTLGHTGEDVQIFSYGKGSHNFLGAMDNSDIHDKLLSYLKR
jgi:alkaline phosphatase